MGLQESQRNGLLGKGNNESDERERERKHGRLLWEAQRRDVNKTGHPRLEARGRPFSHAVILIRWRNHCGNWENDTVREASDNQPRSLYADLAAAVGFCSIFVLLSFIICVFACLFVFSWRWTVSRDLCCVRCECTNPWIRTRGHEQGRRRRALSLQKRETNKPLVTAGSEPEESKLIWSFSVTNVRWRRPGLTGAGRWGEAAAAQVVSCGPGPPSLRAAPLALTLRRASTNSRSNCLRSKLCYIGEKPPMVWL